MNSGTFGYFSGENMIKNNYTINIMQDYTIKETTGP